MHHPTPNPTRLSAHLAAATLALILGACAPSSPARGDDGTPDAAITGPSPDATVDPGPDSGPRWVDTGRRPSGRFDDIWSDLGAGDSDLGYPLADEIATAICAWQPFARGWLIWLESRVVAESCQEFCDLPRIFAAVYPGSDPTAPSGERYYERTDDWSEALPELQCPEANATVATVGGETKAIGPIRGFGKVWCDYEEVRQDVGVAIAPERGGPAFADCRSQLFQGGLIVHNPNAEDASYWVFFSDSRAWLRVPQ